MFINFYLFGDHTRDVEIRPLSESQYDTFSSSVSLEASMCLFPTQYERVSTWRDKRDSENGKSACPVCLWQTGQADDC